MKVCKRDSAWILLPNIRDRMICGVFCVYKERKDDKKRTGVGIS